MVSLLLFLGGIALIITGVIIFVEKFKMLKSGIETEGKVIGFEKRVESYLDHENKMIYIPVYKPIVQFKDKDGIISNVILEDYEVNRLYEIGEEINIVCSNDDSSEICINDKGKNIKVLCNLISLGIVFIIIAIVLYLV